jgi:chloride channel 7
LEEHFGFAKKCRFVLAFFVYAGANMLLVMLAAMLCVYIGPSAAGSGIPEVKAYLNGVDTPHVFSLNTLVVKVRECLFRIYSIFGFFVHFLLSDLKSL